MKYKLGEFIEIYDERNLKSVFGTDSVRGISTDKKFIKTKAKLEGVNLTSYKLSRPQTFAYVPDTSRRGEKMSLAYNNTQSTFLVSSISTVFRVIKSDKINSDYLYMYFNRPEFDRFSRFNSWGSARETFSWEDMCEIEIELPSLEIQEKYVAVYKALLDNQKSYENGLEDLKLVCDLTIEKLRGELPSIKLKEYIELTLNKNTELILGLSSVRGISIEKKFIETKAKMNGISLKPYLIVAPDEFAFVSVTSRNSDKISIAQNNSDESYLCSSSYITFKISKTEKLIPGFLSMFIRREEFDRYVRFNSWGSARETFGWEDMQDVKIPIPSLDFQKSIVEIYNAYITRREMNEKLKTQIKEVCPILINGAIREAREYVKV